jgi:amino acid transporter
VGIVLLCLLWLFKNRNACSASEPLWCGGNWCRPALAVAIMVVYTALMEVLGYSLSTLLFLIVWQRLVEREKWRKTAAITVAGTVVMYILFVYLLQVALPEGMLGI